MFVWYTDIIIVINNHNLLKPTSLEEPETSVVTVPAERFSKINKYQQSDNE